MGRLWILDETGQEDAKTYSPVKLEMVEKFGVSTVIYHGFRGSYLFVGFGEKSKSSRSFEQFI